MAVSGLWKYYTKQQHRDYILSLGLLPTRDWSSTRDWLAEDQLRCLYTVSGHTERHYTRHRIPKGDGTCRELLEPDPLLKAIQRNLLHRVLEELPVSPHATAYRMGGSILAGAVPHLGSGLILKMDIRDFFGSITYLMVYRSAFPRIYFPPAAATLFAHLCCCRDSLPQGAPTSAAVSNLVMKPFDDHMGGWCAERGIVYTRYCDDMTFSGDFSPPEVIRKVRSFLLSLGFVVNEGKTRVLPAGRRQAVTGIVVNEKPQVPRNYRDKLRQELFYLRRYGVAGHLQRLERRDAAPSEGEQVRYLQSLLGRINFVLQVDAGNRAFAEARGEVLRLLTG